MIYVIIQFSLLIYMAFDTPWFYFSYIPLILFCFSIILGLWSIISMGWGNLSIFPNPKENSKIRTSGPYRWIRHPMYTAVIIFSAAMVLMNPVWQMYLAWLFLITDLIFKLRYEEKILMKKFAVYSDYKKGTYSLIPYIY